MTGEDEAYIEEVNVPLTAVQYLDANVIACIPHQAVDVTIREYGRSFWTRTARLDFRVNGLDKTYFLKVTHGDRGQAMVEAEFLSMSILYDVLKETIPRPIAQGTYANDSHIHFLTCEFRNMTHDLLPDPDHFSTEVANIHLRCIHPKRLFGFAIPTFHGNVPIKRGWFSTWEAFFAETTREALQQERAAQGPCSVIDDLEKPFFANVVPRLLRPLDHEPNRIDSTLLHGDLWHANTGVDCQTGFPIMFDAASFYAHNECQDELAVWRTEWNKIGKPYIDAYHRHIPQSKPREDYEDRNILYTIRVNILDSIPVKGYMTYRERFIASMKYLVEKYPDGHQV